MKKLTTLFLSLMSTALIAQIPNPSFETWATGLPTQWSSFTQVITPISVTQSSTAEAGSLAVQLNTNFVSGHYTSGAIFAGLPNSGFFLNNGNPVALNGFYVLTVSGGDELDIITTSKCSPNVSNGVGGVSFTTSTPGSNVYKQFSVLYTYSGACTSDSAAIQFVLTNHTGDTHNGSTALIDNLSFGPFLGIADIGKNVTLEDAYPNPAGTTCNIIYSIPSDATVNVKLYDISGREVATLLNDTKQTPGRYKIPVDVSDYANGVYIYRVTVDGQSFAQKLTVAR